MSNHFSADNLKFPGDDRRLDLTDVFAFTAPHDPDTTVLIIDSNPTSAPPPIPAPVTGPEFYPGAVYRINIDTDATTWPTLRSPSYSPSTRTAGKPGPPGTPPDPRPASPGPSARYSPRTSRSASTAWPSPCR